MHIHARWWDKLHHRACHGHVRWLHLPFTWISGFITLVIVALALSHLNWSEMLRRGAVLQLRYSLQRDVTLGKLSIDPHGLVQVSNLVIYDGLTRHRKQWAARLISVHFDPLRLWAAPMLPLSAIQQVTIESPYVLLTRDQRGQWNFHDLVKPPSGKPSQDRFRGEVLVHNGEFVYQDAHLLRAGLPPIDEHLVRLNARVNTRGDDLPFRVSAVSLSGHAHAISASGNLCQGQNGLLCSLRFTDLNLPYWRQFALASLPLTLTSGHADGRLEVGLAPDPLTGKQAWQYTLLVDLRDLRGSYDLGTRSLPFTLARGQLSVADNLVELAGVNGDVDGIPFAVDGAISRFARPIFSLQARVSDASVTRIVRLLPAAATLPVEPGGTLTCWMQILGPLSALQISGHFAGPSLHTTQGELTDLQADFSYNGSALRLANLSGRGFGGSVSGDLWVNLAASSDLRALFHGEVAQVDIQTAITRLLPKPIALTDEVSLPRDLYGTVTGPLTVSVDHHDHVAVMMRMQGTAQLAGLTQGDFDASVRLAIDDAGAHTTIERGEIHLPEGTLQLHGSVAPDTTVDADIRGSALDLAALAAHAHREGIAGMAYLDGHLSGLPSQLTWQGAVHVQHGAVSGHRFDDLYGQVDADLASPPRLAVSQLRVIAGDNQVLLPTATVALDPQTHNWAIGGEVTLARTSLKALAASCGLAALPVDGLVEAHATLRAGPTMQVEGSIRVSHPVYSDGKSTLALDEVTLPFALDDNTLKLTDAHVIYHGMDVALDGVAELNMRHPSPAQLALHAQATVNLDEFTTLVHGDDPLIGRLTDDFRVRIPADIQGTFKLAGTITAQLTPPSGGTLADTLLNSLQVEAKLDGGNSVQLVGIPFQQFSAKLAYRNKDHTLTVDQFHIARVVDDGSYGSYCLSIPTKSTLNLATGAVNSKIQLSGADRQGLNGDADLELLRRDLAALPENVRGVAEIGDMQAFRKIPGMAQLNQAVRGIPLPFGGHALVDVTVTQSLERPNIIAKVNAENLHVGGDAMPDLDAQLSFNSATGEFICDHFYIQGGLSTNAYASLSGSATLPVKDARTGKEITPGEMSFDFDVDKIDLSRLGSWLNNPLLSQFRGKAKLDGQLEGFTSSPHMIAHLNVTDPGYGEFPGYGAVRFDNLHAYLELKDDRLSIGGPKKSEPTSLQFVGTRQLLAAALKNKLSPDTVPMKDLQFSGSLPVRWKGSLQPYIPLDEPVQLTVNLPSQGLDLVRAYLPPANQRLVKTGKDNYLFCLLPGKDEKDAQAITLPRPLSDAGTVAASLTVSGSLNNPVIEHGVFRAQVPEVILPLADEDLPNRLRQVSLDIGFRSDIATGNNLLEVKDLSAIYDRVETAAPRKSNKYVNWFSSLLGRGAKQATFSPGAIVAQGTIGIDTKKILAAKTFSADQLTYDCYAKMVRTPLHWRQLFQGTVTAYLRLGNHPETQKPRVTGVIYAEKSRLTFEEQGGGAAAAPTELPFNPELELALQMGPGNVFAITPANPLTQNTLSAEIPFRPTALFPPISPADLVYMPRAGQSNLRAMKPLIDKDYSSYRYTSETMSALVDKDRYAPDTPNVQADKGTFGWLTGSLAHPHLRMYYSVLPSKARMQLPGGTLTFREASGDLSLPLLSGDLTNARLYCKAMATGMMDKYSISANIDGDFAKTLDPKTPPKEFPVTFATESAPQGAQPLSSDDIRDRLIGLTDFASLLQGTAVESKGSMMRVGQNLFLRGWFDKLAQGLGLETFNVDLDPTLAPETTLVTPELGKPVYGTIRLGVTRTFAVPPSWRVWGDYRLPSYRLFGGPNLSNFSLSGDLDDQQEQMLSLQYKFRF